MQGMTAKQILASHIIFWTWEPAEELKSMHVGKLAKKEKMTIQGSPGKHCEFPNKVCIGRFWPTGQRTSTICTRMRQSRQRRTGPGQDVSTDLNIIEKTDADIAVTDANDTHQSNSSCFLSSVLSM
ncbi:unnamed protein product [Cylicocyclus nassatus]|uniref:Uncharacterized protein n=1 Tax=Cylicocyclus nassatus TaxID=53992 RepID=A0AA36GZT8_CYLNA|nr:unnamed protein product [Cylicocyclus nassatus]